MFQMVYEISSIRKKKKSHRVSALNKVDDKYNYENVNFPASLNDIEQFELNNEISFFAYSVSDKDEIFRERLGNMIALQMKLYIC